MNALNCLLLAAGLTSGIAAQAQAVPVSSTALDGSIRDLIVDPSVAGAHWGISVTAMDGTPLEAIHDAEYFRPASTAKLFTTAAALALLGPASTVTTTVTASNVFTGNHTLTGDLFLSGVGDANLSGRTIPYARDTEEAAPPLRFIDDLADQIAATGLKTVNGDVIGVGDSLGYEPYPRGWVIDDLVWGYGAPVSALTVNDNQLRLTVTPGATLGDPAIVAILPEIGYYSMVNQTVTVGEKEPAMIQVERMPGTKVLRVYGRMPLKGSPEIDHIAIQDPPEFAAMALKRSLLARGITVTGQAIAEHAGETEARGFQEIGRQPLDLDKAKATGRLPSPGAALCTRPPCDAAHLPQNRVVAQHVSPALLDDVTVTNKDSINLHAELLLRRLGDRFAASGSFAEGARVVRQFVVSAGIRGQDVILFDGSGLSAYDEVTPRAETQMLRFGATQSWGAGWKASFPIGGVDGTLSTRFTGTLKGRVIAKTGTLGEARALAGYLVAASGRTVLFSVMVDEHAPGNAGADRAVMDKIIEAIAAAY